MAGQQAYARFNIVVGTNGTGKSTRVGEIIKKTHYRNTIVYIEEIDAAGTQFGHLPLISFYEYKGGKVKVSADEVPFDKFINAVADHYRNGLLVIDEAGIYQLMEKGNLIPSLIKLLKQRRKYNIEIYLLYHSASEVPVKLFKWCNNVILFHQTDEFRHKAAVIPRADELRAAQARIAKQYFAGNLYYCERVQLS